MESERVGIREFRENLARYIESAIPVAITRHGETVGFYVPARRNRSQADLDAFVDIRHATGPQLLDDPVLAQDLPDQRCRHAISPRVTSFPVL